MTREEAIDKMEFCKRAYQRMIDENSQEGVFVGKGFEGKWKADTPLYKVYEDMRDACDMSIKALEQEPCGDAISRQATIEAFQMFRGYESNRTNAEWVDRIETVVEKLPPVNPQPKTGHWIPVSERLPNNHEYIKNKGLFNVSDGNRSYSEYFDIYDTERFGEPTMSGFRVDRCVIAWMPLPEPYKEESEDI